MSHSRVLAIIPARGGSKGVPRKNVRDVGGRPLISYTIEAAQASRVVTRIVTTTDDEEIAAVAGTCGSAVIRRPADLAQDDTPMVPVVMHALAEAEREQDSFDYILVLQPTAPLRTAAHIDAGMKCLMESGDDSIVSVYEVGDAHPARMYRQENERLVPFDAALARRLRQELPAVYHRNGALYACRRNLLLERNVLFSDMPLPYVMKREDSINIDDEIDLLLADLVLRRRRAL